MKNTAKDKIDQSSNDVSKDFTSMPNEKAEEITHKGDEARVDQLEHEGYMELAHKGGSAPTSPVRKT